MSKNMIKKFLKNKNVIVTGADGFIGSHLTEELTKLNCNLRVMTYYNSLNSWGWLDTIDKNVLKNIEVVPGDIRDTKSVKKLCKKADYIFHLASLIAIPHSYDSPYSYLETNALGTMNLLESCFETNVEKIIHTSTSEVYGEYNKIPISESSRVLAKSPYSATKIAADQIAYSYQRSFGLPVSIIRPFNTYGPRQSSRAIIPTIITQILSEKIVKLGSLDPTRDFSYITDTINGYLAVAENKNSVGEIINIGSGYEISIDNLYKLICEIMKTKTKLVIDSKRVRPKEGEVDRLKADIKKAKSLLNWKPKYSGKTGLKEGLSETIEWFKDKKNLRFYKSNLYNK